jgi:hypothetical protein
VHCNSVRVNYCCLPNFSNFTITGGISRDVLSWRFSCRRANFANALAEKGAQRQGVGVCLPFFLCAYFMHIGRRKTTNRFFATIKLETYFRKQNECNSNFFRLFCWLLPVSSTITILFLPRCPDHACTHLLPPLTIIILLHMKGARRRAHGPRGLPRSVRFD